MFDDLPQFFLPALAAVAALALGLALGAAWQARSARRGSWPREFRLNARPVFTTSERLLFRELRAALPQHVVLAKLNLLRFCQSASDREARLWFDRLHTLNVSFAICTPQGTVISVIDLETPQRRRSERGQRLKEAVLESCRIRYIRCESGHWPRAELLAQWALGAMPRGDAGAQGSAVAGTPGHGQSAPLAAARAELARKLHLRRAERASRFQDSQFASDSFFADSRGFDAAAANSEPAPLFDAAPPGKAAAASGG